MWIAIHLLKRIANALTAARGVVTTNAVRVTESPYVRTAYSLKRMPIQMEPSKYYTLIKTDR